MMVSNDSDSEAARTRSALARRPAGARPRLEGRDSQPC